MWFVFVFVDIEERSDMINLNVPIMEEVSRLVVGDVVRLKGCIFCGRDAALPRICKEISENVWINRGIDLTGTVIFHTAVSPAGIGPTSSNKVEIEGSFSTLSKAGVKMHLGKGAISKDTIAELDRLNAVYAIIPPVTALLESKTSDIEVVAYPELGMEAFHRVKVEGYEVIIAAAHGKSIYDK